MWPNPQGTVELVTFTEEILNGKLHFLCSELLLWISRLLTWRWAPKYQLSKKQVIGTISILIISETKPDSNFTDDEFLIEWHPPFISARNKNGEGSILYVSEDISLRLLKRALHCSFNWIRFLEINKLYYVITENWHFQQIESWFQLTEKFEYVQSFQLIENENEWIVFDMEGNMC